jgi:penicillin-binding protein 1B
VAGVPAEAAEDDAIERVYTGRFRHEGIVPATGLRIVIEIPRGLHYVAGSATGPRAEISVSADGGRSFAPPDELTLVVPRPAMARRRGRAAQGTARRLHPHPLGPAGRVRPRDRRAGDFQGPAGHRGGQRTGQGGRAMSRRNGKKSRARRGQARGILRRIAPLALAIALLGVVALAAWMIWLDARITAQFEGRRWDQPAQVFAEPSSCMPACRCIRGRVHRTARRAGLPGGRRRRAPGGLLVAPGQQRAADDAAVPFRGRRCNRPPSRRSISARAGVSRIRDAQGRDLPLLRLDPMRIGSIFPAHGEDRIVLAPDEIPALLADALIAVEDRRFARHRGIDPEGIGRALMVNLRAGEVRQGGSTLTQQLVKSYFLDSRRTWGRKITEAAMAILLEWRYEKDDILTAYINEVFMGQDGQRAIHGFGLASAFYFGKPLPELDEVETATLVAIVRGPSFYNPWRHPQRVRERRDLVLEILAEQEVITAEAAAEGAIARTRAARQRRLRTRLPAGLPRPGAAPAAARLPRLGPGFRRAHVLTTLDPLAQRKAQAAVTAGIERLRERGGDAAGVEGAAVVTRPATGEVLAVVGSALGTFDGFNRALDARRPIGSLVKPAVFLAALETGEYSLASTLADLPVDVPLPNGTVWQPTNFDNEVRGPVSMMRALAESLNLATVDLGLESASRPWPRKWAGWPAARRRRRCPRCCSARSSTRRWRWRRCTGRWRPAGSARRCARCAPCSMRRASRCRATRWKSRRWPIPRRSRSSSTACAWCSSAARRAAPPAGSADGTSPAKPALPATFATAGSRASGAILWPWSGSGATTTSPPG